MTKIEAKETFLNDNFLYGYYDDKNEITRDTIEYIIDEIYSDSNINLRYCKDCSILSDDTIDVFEEELPIWAIGRCTMPGHLYRKAVSPDFGCNLWRAKNCEQNKH